MAQIFSDLSFETQFFQKIRNKYDRTRLLPTKAKEEVDMVTGEYLFWFFGVINKIGIKIAKSFPKEPKL